MPCDDIRDSVMATLSSGFDCIQLSDGALLVTTADTYADGDRPELLVVQRGDTLVATDFGTVLGRLMDVGVNPEGEGFLNALTQTVKGFQVDYVNGELRVALGEDGGDALLRLTNAMLQVDGLRWLASEPRGERFGTRLVSWLRELPGASIEAQPRVVGRSGKAYRLTAAAAIVEPIYIQAVTPGTTKADSRSVDHTFRVFADVDGQLRDSQKLVVLGDIPSAFDSADVR